MRFEDFDSRGYRTVDVRTGYAGWVDTYDRTVQDVMDLSLLDRLEGPSWSTTRRAVDLGCGTGRTGEWLRERGVEDIDGVDVTPEMLDSARVRGTHNRIFEADVRDTGLPAGAYDLAVASLLDEHMSALEPLYRETARITSDEAVFALVAFHPHFIMTTGMPTHYTNADGESIAITTNLHLISDHVTAAGRAGWQLTEMSEGVIDDRWLAAKPRWENLRNHPVSVVFAWRKA